MFVEILTALLIGPVVCILIQYFKHLSELHKYPKGAFPLPLIGNLNLVLGKKPFTSLRDLSEKYGEVFSLSFGMERIVIINDVINAKEALMTKGLDYSARPNFYSTSFIDGGNGITFNINPKASLFMRKLVAPYIRMHGAHLQQMEEITIAESEDLIRRLAKKNGEPLDPQYQFACSMTNVICGLQFSKRYQVDDEEFRRIHKYSEILTTAVRSGVPIDVFPWLRFFPSESLRLLKEAKRIQAVFKEKYWQHKNTFDERNLRDLIDHLILSSKADASKWKELGYEGSNIDENIIATMQDLIIGGSETVKTMLYWSILFLLHWPQYQDEIYTELQQNVQGKSPRLSDQVKCHLTRAFINEVFRYVTIAPLGVPYKTTRDTILGTKSIPKGAQVIVNYWAIHHDPNYWDHPDEFIPQRWLNESGEFEGNTNKGFYPFSMGRRSCPGDVLAKMELFIIFSSVVRNFEILPSDEENLPSLEGHTGVSRIPEDYKCVFKPRNIEEALNNA